MSLFRRNGDLSGRGRAAILEAGGPTFQKTSLQGRDADGLPVRSKLRLRVVPDDGLPEFESSLAVWRGDQGHFDALHWTYVRFDPAHPDRCEIDSDRLEQEFGPADPQEVRTMNAGRLKQRPKAGTTRSAGSKIDVVLGGR